MDIRETILAEHSKATCNRIVRWIGGNQQRFDHLFSLFLKDEPLVVQRAAWPVSYAVEAHPGFITKHFPALLKKMETPGIHDAVKRNSLRLLQVAPIPEKYRGRIMNSCFQFIAAAEEKPAIKAFSLAILEKMAQTYPDILPEIKTIISYRWNDESAAFRSRARRILKML